MDTLILYITSFVVSYFIGAIPFASSISKLYGVDIFSIGTKSAGTSNVVKSVGLFPGVIVAIGDITKGVAVTVLGSSLFGIEGVLLIFPIMFGVLGHWNSVFSKFRGGDGVASLTGAFIVISPYLAILGIVIGYFTGIVAAKLGYSSLIGVVSAFIIAGGMTVWFGIVDVSLIIALGLMTLIVVVHAVIRHRKFEKI